MKKKLLLIFTMLIIIAVYATPAMAATVCKIGNKGYSSLEAAIKAAKKGQTITVTNNISTKKTVGIDTDENIIIDFANKKYTYTGSSKTAAFEIMATVTFKNMNLYAKTSDGINVSPKSTLVISSGVYHGGPIRNDRGTISIKGGNFIFNVTEKNNPDAAGRINNYGVLKISNGNFNAESTPRSNCCLQNSSKCTISGGTFKNEILNFGSLTITGGKFAYVTCDKYSDDPSQIIIKGGNFTTVEVREDTTAAIKGGTFSNNDGPSIVVHGKNAKLTFKGGTFTGIKTVDGGKTTITGGKSIGDIEAGENGVITINSLTANIKEVGNPIAKAALIANDGGKIIVNGGSFTYKTGYGYALFGTGKVTFGVKDPAKLFNVKELVYKG